MSSYYYSQPRQLRTKSITTYGVRNTSPAGKHSSPLSSSPRSGSIGSKHDMPLRGRASFVDGRFMSWKVTRLHLAIRSWHTAGKSSCCYYGAAERATSRPRQTRKRGFGLAAGVFGLIAGSTGRLRLPIRSLKASTGFRHWF